MDVGRWDKSSYQQPVRYKLEYDNGKPSEGKY